MTILGTWSNHDSSFSILSDDGEIINHIELERILREKEVKADAVKYGLEFCKKNNINFTNHATCFPLTKTTQHENSWNELNQILIQRNGKSFTFAHHLSHASNAFFSSNLKEATIVTLDGGGLEENNFASACSIYYGKDNKIFNIKTFHVNEINIGGLYSRCTRYIFRLPAGGKYGSHQGSVMSVASYGEPNRFLKDFEKMLRQDLVIASYKPQNQPQDLDPKNEVEHIYLSKYRELIEKEGWETETQIASALQTACENQIFEVIDFALKNSPIKDVLCLSGGVALNCVAVGKLWDKFPQLKQIYIPAICGDANLCLGASQYLFYHVQNRPRKYNSQNQTPFLGENFSDEEILDGVEKRNDDIVKSFATDDDILNLIERGKVIAIFNGGSESGKRALGNRSIIADPRNSQMKDIINNKIKNRKNYRPVAPSILREYVKDYFEKDVDSPYMSFALKVKENMREKIPTVVHVDGTARLQTVSKSDNLWYYNFLIKWHKKSGVPVLVNTSFNDNEPIAYNINHGINCLLKTQLDGLYIPSLKMLIRRI